MARFRRQISIARLCAAVLVVALAFAWLRPWQMAISVAIGMLIPIFISGLAWIEVAVILAIAFVMGALMMPAVSTRCYSGRKPRVAPVTPAAPAPALIAPVTPPGQD